MSYYATSANDSNQEARQRKKNKSQDKQILEFFRASKESYAVHEAASALGFRRENSAARSMSTLSSVDPDVNKYLDQYGNPPLIKTNETTLNQYGDATVHKWAWNGAYGSPTPQLGMFNNQTLA